MGAPRRLAIILAALAAWPSPASAHAGVASTSPPGDAPVADSPPVAAMVFRAPVEDAFLRMEVRPVAGGPPVSTPARLRPGDDQIAEAELPPDLTGAYEVTWRAFSQDGHATSGTWGFTVGAAATPGGAPAAGDGADGAVLVAARGLLILGPVLLLGLAACRRWVLGRAVTAASGRVPGLDAALEPAAAAALRLGTAGVALWAVGLALAAAGTLRALGEGAAALGTLLGDTRWGLAWWLQLAGLAAAAAGTAATRRAPAAATAAQAAGAGLALCALAWAGHASSGNDRAIGIGADALHGLATGLWVGGLAALAVIVVPVLGRLGGDGRVALAAGAVVRFSSLAVACVCVLVVTGVYRALAEVPRAGELTGSGYGQALLVKLGVFGVMLAVGGYNRFVVHPRLERAALGLDPGDRGAARRLRTSLAAELVLAAGVLAAVAVMVSVPPPV